MLGLYVSDHPLFGVEHILAAGADCSIAALQDESRPDGQVVTVGGILSGVQRKVTKKGDTWVLTTLEDLEGAIEVMIFPSAYQLCSTDARRGRDRLRQGPPRQARGRRPRSSRWR